MKENDLKKEIVDRLGHLSRERESVKDRVTDEALAFFDIADCLTCVVKGCLEIRSTLSPEIVSVLSAVIVGIGNKDVFGEVEMLMAMKDMKLQKESDLH